VTSGGDVTGGGLPGDKMTGYHQDDSAWENTKINKEINKQIDNTSKFFNVAKLSKS